MDQKEMDEKEERILEIYEISDEIDKLVKCAGVSREAALIYLGLEKIKR